MRIGRYNVELVDNGTMDTAVKISKGRFSEVVVFDCEYASSLRDENGILLDSGLQYLGIEAIEGLGLEREMAI